MSTFTAGARVQFTDKYSLVQFIGKTGIVMDTKHNGAIIQVLLDPPLQSSGGVPIDSMWVFGSELEPESESDTALESHGLFVDGGE